MFPCEVNSAVLPASTRPESTSISRVAGSPVCFPHQSVTAQAGMADFSQNRCTQLCHGGRLSGAATFARGGGSSWATVGVFPSKKARLAVMTAVVICVFHSFFSLRECSALLAKRQGRRLVRAGDA